MTCRYMMHNNPCIIHHICRNTYTYTSHTKKVEKKEKKTTTHTYLHITNNRIHTPPHTGKSTFIKHLLGRDYPGINIGPEPTTDRFVVVMNGLEERRTPGNTLVVQPDKPYQVCGGVGGCRCVYMCVDVWGGRGGCVDVGVCVWMCEYVYVCVDVCA